MIKIAIMNGEQELLGGPQEVDLPGLALTHRNYYECFKAYSDREALSMLRHEPFDLFILCIAQPYLDSWKFYQTLKSDDAWCDVPVIIISSRSRFPIEPSVAYLAAGDAFVYKPLESQDMLEAVANALTQRGIPLPPEHTRGQNLDPAIKDEHEWVRHDAVMALGKIEADEAIELLTAALVKSDRKPQAADQILAKIGTVKPLAAMLAGENEWWVHRAAALALGQIGDASALEPLTAALAGEDWRVRWAAAQALGELGDVGALAPLIAALADKSDQVRRIVAWALGQLQTPQAIEPLLRVLHDPAPLVSKQAASTLVQIGGPAVDLLVEKLSDPQAHVRRAVVTALPFVRDQRAVELLVALLQDSNTPGDLAWATVYALGQLGDAQALPVLEHAEGDARKNKYGWPMSDAARRAIQWIQAAQW